MTQEEALDTLDDLLKLDSGMSAWELDFVESLDSQRGRDFTEKQIAVLERIAAKLLK